MGVIIACLIKRILHQTEEEDEEEEEAGEQGEGDDERRSNSNPRGIMNTHIHQQAMSMSSTTAMNTGNNSLTGVTAGRAAFLPYRHGLPQQPQSKSPTGQAAAAVAFSETLLSTSSTV